MKKYKVVVEVLYEIGANSKAVAVRTAKRMAREGISGVSSVEVNGERKRALGTRVLVHQDKKEGYGRAKAS